jgi:hypothetical protein
MAVGTRGTPIRPTIGSLMPDELMPKLKLRRLSSKPSTLLAATPSSPRSESWNHL